MRHFITFPRNLKFLAFMGIVGTLFGCSLLSEQPTPDWVDGNSQQFPNELYLVGRGEADSRESAEQRAYAGVARIFSARVKAQLRDSELYSQMEGEEKTTTSRQLTLDHLTHVSTDKILEDVQILDAWHHSDDGRYFALAGLERAKTEQMLLERISAYDKAIHMNVEAGQKGTDVLTKLRGFKRAVRDLRARQVANADLQIIRVTGEGIPAPYAAAQIQRKLNEYLLHEVRIDVRISGDQKAQIQQAIWDGLNREGFVTLDQNQRISGQHESDLTLHTMSSDLLITGTTRLDDLKLFDPLFKYVRWCSDLQIIESHGQRVIGIVSRSGREGHITQHEARVKATHKMQETVSTEIARSLARYIYDDNHMALPSSSSCLPPM